MSRRLAFRAFLAAGLLVAVALVAFLAPRASSEPDGLNKVAAEQGFSDRETNHALDDSPTAGYTIDGADSAWGTVGAGLIGLAVTFALAGGLFLVVRRRNPGTEAPGTAGTPGSAGAPS